MDLEQLTKHQIILLTLLVSFVTSIATGIVTVSLMDQAPPSVTQTINRIVERTVETVVPADLPAATATEKTIVIKDDELAAQSIADVQKAIVRIVRANDPSVMLARGVIVDEKGMVLTDRAAFAQSRNDRLEAILSSGARVPFALRQEDTQGAIATGDLVLGTSTPTAAKIADVSKLQLGQSVIRIGGAGNDTVGVGVIASLPAGEERVIEASVSSATPGSLLMTIFGEIVGLVTAESLSLSPTAEWYTLVDKPEL